MFPAGRGAALTVADALIAFQSYVENARVEFSSPQGTLSFEDLGRIVPRQQVAPVQFAIVDGRIVVDQRSPQTDQADRDNIISALEHICSSGDQLISNLDNSKIGRAHV